MLVTLAFSQSSASPSQTSPSQTSTTASGQTSTATSSQNSAPAQPAAATSAQAAATPASSTTPHQNDPQEPSLGAYARAVRKDKVQAKVYDNDNLPMNDKISVVGDSSAPPAADNSTDSQNANQPPTAANQENPKVIPGQTQQQRQQVYDKWQEKITIQQDEVNQIARELDLDQREYRLRAAAFYADAGNRLRDQANWDKEDADYKQKIADQQKALDEAKQKLSDLQEEARKSGVPDSSRQPATPENNEQ
jgi:hypothetical protein